MRVLSIDADANPETARAYGVMGLPTLALFVGGELVTQVVGARSQPALMKAFAPHL
jgi:thioredoxin 1